MTSEHELASRLTAIVRWLEANQPDVFRRGLWDAINAATQGSLCWHCSKVQGFYESPCPHCGATNPNMDLEKAQKEVDKEYPQ